jgi:GNAT superfamily N-acetyltransferase
MMAETDPWKYLQWTSDECETSLRGEGLRLHGAYDEDSALIGFLASLDHGIGFEPLIEYLCVGASARNQGVGSALISFFETELHPQARNFYLFVSDINDDAQRLYLRRGYLPVGALPNFNLTGQTEFLFRKGHVPLTATALTRAALRVDNPGFMADYSRLRRRRGRTEVACGLLAATAVELDCLRV